MVGRETSRERLPAVLMSSPNSSTIVGISSSPPTTPMIAATTPMPHTAATPHGTWAHRGSASVSRVVVWVTTRAAAMSTIRAARTLYEGGGPHADRPACSGPGSEQAAGQQVDRDWPACGDLGGRDRRESGGQGDQDHDQAHRFDQDDGRECRGRTAPAPSLRARPQGRRCPKRPAALSRRSGQSARGSPTTRGRSRTRRRGRRWQPDRLCVRRTGRRPPSWGPSSPRGSRPAADRRG
ncbi:hypothetical protein QFZ22_001213 [Streptomyces canus]|uniref:Uncharacterized protein n=1 Tax=Streptomyces canus TaxID=58343 RepID=A0AAW8F8T0_9ACTN|nr:hypothetical protein [Streptomyces canus]